MLKISFDNQLSLLVKSFLRSFPKVSIVFHHCFFLINGKVNKVVTTLKCYLQEGVYACSNDIRQIGSGEKRFAKIDGEIRGAKLFDILCDLDLCTIRQLFT